MKKNISLLLILMICLLSFTGCTNDPTGSSSVPPSSNPSSEVPPSSNPSSEVPPSSQPDPVYPEVHISAPVGEAAMMHTLSRDGYIDRNGILHYSPEYKEYIAEQGNNIVNTAYTVLDGAAGAKSIYKGDTTMHVLMKNGTIRMGLGVISQKQANALSFLKYQNICAMAPFFNDGVPPSLDGVFALQGSLSKGANFIASDTIDMDVPTKGIVQMASTYQNHLLPVLLYTDGTIGLSPKELKNEAPERKAVHNWENVVQIAVYDLYFLLGLEEDGTLLDACIDDIFAQNNAGGITRAKIPEEFRKNISRMFADDIGRVILQRSDGAVYSVATGKNYGTFEMFDQIIHMPSGRYNDLAVLGVDASGKVHCLSHNVETLKKWDPDSAAVWALTLTDVKTVRND